MDDHQPERPAPTPMPPLDKLATALAKAQGMMRNAKKENINPHFRNSYADLASVLDACRAPLSENGLSVVQLVATSGAGIIVTTILLHSSGQSIQGDLEVPLRARTAQDVGSAITYGRRYALQAIVGLAADDDDGNVATASAPKETPTDRTRRAVKDAARKDEVSPATNEHHAAIQRLLEDRGVDRARWRSIITGATSKASPAQLDAEDVKRVAGALETVLKVG